MRTPSARSIRALVEALVRKHCDGALPESRAKYRAQLELIARHGHLLFSLDQPPAGRTRSSDSQQLSIPDVVELAGQHEAGERLDRTAGSTRR